MANLNTSSETVLPDRGGPDENDSVYQLPEKAFPSKAAVSTTKQFDFTDPANVPHQSQATPGPGASWTDLNWASVVDPLDGDGTKVADNDWEDPGNINSGMSHAHPAFARATGNKY